MLHISPLESSAYGEDSQQKAGYKPVEDISIIGSLEDLIKLSTTL